MDTASVIAVAILTPDPAEPAYAESWPRILARLQRALGGVGIRSVPTPWTDHVDDGTALKDYACVLPLLAWGYHYDHARMLIQPYLPTIESEGETSLLYFGGRLSHVVNKRPVHGDFRVQEEFGGLYTLLASPPAGAAALAEQVLDAVDEPLLYARIDMVPDTDGRWLLMEAELIEPDFYLGVDPPA